MRPAIAVAALILVLAALPGAEAQVVRRIFVPSAFKNAAPAGYLPTPVATPFVRPDTWTTRAAMPTGRNGLGLAQGPNGKLYAIGGSTIEGATGSHVATVEEYDPAGDAWAMRAPMPTARSQLALVAHPNGRLYAIGGGGAAGALAVVEEYDPVTDSWRGRAPMPTARYGLAAAVMPDGTIYAAGGYNPTSGYLNTVEAYNVTTDTWQPAASLNTARAYLAMAVGSNGSVYAIGGSAVTGSGGDYFDVVEHLDLNYPYYWITRRPMPTRRHGLALVASSYGKLFAVGGYNPTSGFLSKVEEYDPDVDTWAERAPMPTARASLAGTAGWGNRLYLVGGAGTDGARLRSVEAYEAALPSPDTWIYKADVPRPRDGLGLVAGPSGRLYAIGGRAYSFPAPFDCRTRVVQPLAVVDEYDHWTNTWAARSPMPTARAYFGAAALYGKIYAAGGLLAGDQPTASLEEYDPASDTWRTRAPMPTARTGLALVEAAGRLYAIGGFNEAGGHLATVEEYDPTTDSWRARASMPTPRSALAAVLGPDGHVYAFGGANSSAPSRVLDVVEAYDPIADRWRARAPMPRPRQQLAAARTQSVNVYVVGGVGQDYRDFVATDEYSPYGDTWSGVPGLRTGHVNHGLAMAGNGYVYAVGGTATSYGCDVALGRTEEFHPRFSRP